MTSHVSAALAPGGDIPAPHIEYGQIMPILLVLGVAVAGVLVEAFVGRTWRYTVQVPRRRPRCPAARRNSAPPPPGSSRPRSSRC